MSENIQTFPSAKNIEKIKNIFHFSPCNPSVLLFNVQQTVTRDPASQDRVTVRPGCDHDPLGTKSRVTRPRHILHRSPQAVASRNLTSDRGPN